MTAMAGSSQNQPHPFGVPDSKCQNGLSDKIFAEEPIYTRQSNMKYKGTPGGISLTCRNKHWMVVGFFLILGSIGVLLWNIASTEKRIKDLESNVEKIKELLKGMKSAAYSLVTSDSTAGPTTSITTTPLSLITTPRSPMTVSERAISTVTAATTTTAFTSAFQEAQSNEVVFMNHSFLAMQLTIPDDGLSKSEDWCREYQLLCQQQGRSPTGCGEIYTNTDSIRKCSSDYGYDIVAGNVLGCNPWKQTKNVIDMAFPNVVPTPKEIYNIFGFYECEPSSCQRHIKDSRNSLYTYRANAFWEDGGRTVYALCA